MRITTLILPSLLGTLIICSGMTSGADVKADAGEIINLDTLNNKLISSVDSTTTYSEEIKNSGQRSFSKVDSTVSNPLDLLLFCGQYSYFPNHNPLTKSYFEVPYNGCVYNPKYHPNNKLGWAQVILIPKSESEKQFSNIAKYTDVDSAEAVVNRMTLNQLKSKFNPVIFLIESKYLIYKKNAEVNFYPQLPYVKKLIIYKNESKKWISIDSIKVRNEAEDDDWVNKVMDKFNIK